MVKDIGYEDLQSMREINLSLPGGVIGRQAVFSIFENIIRNAAKHGNYSQQNTNNKNLELELDMYDFLLDKDQNRVKNDSAFSEFLEKNNYLSDLCRSELIVLTITDNLFIEKEETVQKLQDAIDELYVDESGQMINRNKGLKEMKISAGWLRDIENDKLEEKAPPLLSVRKTSDNHLQYIICLKKVKKVCVVLDKIPEGLSRQKLFYTEGWRFYSAPQYLTLKNHNFDLILVDMSINMDLKRRILLYSPNRVKMIDQKEISELKGKQKTDQELYAIYLEKWLKIKGRFIPQLIIDDEKVYYKYKTQSDSYALSLLKDKVRIYNKNYLTEKWNSHQKPDYIYRTHHLEKKQFDNFMKYEIPSEFVEGISGHNSTDRLMRIEEINEIWFFQQSNVVSQQIAILDERLFEKRTGRNEKSILQHLQKIKDKKIFLKTIFYLTETIMGL
ncbi:MAG: hypothetical protein LUE98_18905 [Tannerellaceae bacterium]|nr:hypothetical protein [Tannerellaceae bacterium]